MFSGNRRFQGRQGEQIYNEELYGLYEILKHYLEVPENPDPKFGPDSGLEKPGALWLDRQTSPGYAHLMYNDTDKVWKPLYDDWFKLIKEIRKNKDEIKDPLEGQLWINDSGVLHWHNGDKFVPIKSKLADATEFDANTFQNFLIIDPLKMSGGYIVENLSKIAQIAGGIKPWQPNTLYQDGDLVFHTDSHGETYFYQISDPCGDPHTSELTFEEDYQSGYLSKIDLSAQYLIPSETLDKVFIDGFYTGDDVYTRLSDVCIQISLSLYQGKTVAAVHVNPVALKNIRKRMVRIEKNEKEYGEYAMIKVGPDNTEYYGVSQGFGTLLEKDEDYIVKANGIQLKGNAIDMYDFVYCITYEFETRIKNEGVLYRDTIKLSNQTCIYIGQIDPRDKLLVFVQGLCLEDFYWSYDCYDTSGLVKFNGFDKNGKITSNPAEMVKPLFESKSDVAIMRFRRKTNTGVFTPDMLENARVDEAEVQYEGEYTENGMSKFIASITIPAEYRQPLVFVQGPNLTVTLGDFEVVGNKAIIKGATPGSAYYIVDAVRINDQGELESNMFVSSGTITSDCSIPITDPEILSGECQPLVFVDGFYISIRDLDTTSQDCIKIHGLTEGQTYTLLKDKNDELYQLLFDGEVAFTTIPVKNEIDDAIVYISNAVIIDGGACYSTSKSTDYAASNEIRLILSDGVEKWHYFNARTKSWQAFDDEDYEVMLDMASSGYSVDTKAINILQNFGDVDCTYYAYRFADNIEKPLIKGYTSSWIEDGSRIFYKMDFRHAYPKGENALHVWINGVKQDIEEGDIKEEIDGKVRTIQGFYVPKPTDAFGNELDKKPTCFYIIERPETGEYQACSSEYLGQPVGINTYITTDTILAPGVPRVFVDGYRQPKNAYIVNNMNTITIIDPVLTDEKNTVMVTNEKGENTFIEAKSRSSVLVEMRQDYRLKEKTVKITEENLEYIVQGSTAIFDTATNFYNNQRLPIDLFLSKTTEICIYINGAAYGKDFSKDKNYDAIILTNADIVKGLRAGDQITFEWR